MPPILAFIVLLGLAIWSFVNPNAASVYYMVVVYLYVGVLFVMWLIYRRRKFELNPRIEFTNNEKFVIGKYFLHCQYTMSSVNRAAALGLICLLNIPVGLWLLYNAQYALALAILFSNIPAGFLSNWFNPVNRLKKEYEKTGDESVLREMNAIRSSICKINEIA